ncbi:ABC transporter ATP-binding protein [Thermosediminibacter litoriperuensis]|uniref:NitT/TauT family transport system ATP-binding protein n=1 Tax=Thermosediminibacter litoriperuensis TaxID=291989 RepID=A0A5S5AY97_9FIRM|nr:ABC transporter ATP-binding protein [Thermosediminibacter litoriperuensis]TYP57447.1 NitT/TauT family transport system ATP-binding protein [Thermosediminibacter litoriperuensis]
MEPLIKVTGLTKIYGTSGQTVAGIKDVNFDVMEGELVSVIGRSGCGKTTLLRCIAGFEKYDGGEIFLDGKRVCSPGPDRFMVFQGLDQLFPWLTVRGNVIFAMKTVHKGMTPKELRERAGYYLELVGLSGWADCYPYQLSGGMKQRAFLARALSVNPRVLLMDEPFGSLDAFGRRAMQELLLKLWEKTGVTIVFVTHDIDECIKLSDRILVFASGSLKAILANPLPRPRQCEDAGYRNFFAEVSRMIGEEAGAGEEPVREPAVRLKWADATLR